MSEVFSPGGRRAARANMRQGIGDASGFIEETVSPSRRRRRASDEAMPLTEYDEGAMEKTEPYKSRRSRRDLNDRSIEELMREYLRTDHSSGIMRQSVTQTMPGQHSALGQAARLPSLEARSEVLRHPQQQGLSKTGSSGIGARGQERMKELLRAQHHNNKQVLEAQRRLEQARQHNGGNPHQPVIRDRWSLPPRESSDEDRDLTGYLPGRQKVFVDPTASDNLAMVQPADYVHIPGQAEPMMKSPTTSHIPVITANQPVVKNSSLDRGLQDLVSSRSSLLARAEQIATAVDMGAVNARLLQEQKSMAVLEQRRKPSIEDYYPSDNRFNTINNSDLYGNNGPYATSQQPELSVYSNDYAAEVNERNPPIASGEARGLQPINTKIAGSKTRIEKIATIAVTAGISLVFSAVVISIFFIK